MDGDNRYFAEFVAYNASVYQLEDLFYEITDGQLALVREILYNVVKNDQKNEWITTYIAEAPAEKGSLGYRKAPTLSVALKIVKSVLKKTATRATLRRYCKLLQFGVKKGLKQYKRYKRLEDSDQRRTRVSSRKRNKSATAAAAASDLDSNLDDNDADHDDDDNADDDNEIQLLNPAKKKKKKTTKRKQIRSVLKRPPLAFRKYVKTSNHDDDTDLSSSANDDDNNDDDSNQLESAQINRRKV